MSADKPSSEDDVEEVEYEEEIVYEEVTDEEEDAEAEEQVAAVAAQIAAEDARAGAAAATKEAQPPPATAAEAEGSGKSAVKAPHPSNSSRPGEDLFHEVNLSTSPPGPAEAAAGAAPAAAAAAVAGDAAQSGAAGKSDRQGSQGDLLLVEQQASKVAADMASLATQVTHKLQDGLLSAFSGAASITGNSKPTGGAAAAAPGEAAAAAAAALSSKLTGGLTGLSSWWQNLDQNLSANNTPLLAPSGSPADKLKSASTAESQLANLFQLSPSESLVESYSCSLMQTYSCSTNHLTPPMQITFEGKLYITDKHTCFQATADHGGSSGGSSSGSGGGSGGGSSSAGRGPAGAKLKPQKRKIPPLVFKIAHTDVAAATREPSPAKSLAAADLLQIVVNPGGCSGPVKAAPAAGGKNSGGGAKDRKWSVSLQGFDPPSGLDGALALIEHLKEG